jgi:hypothetical protein
MIYTYFVLIISFLPVTFFIIISYLTLQLFENLNLVEGLIT